MAQTSSHKSPAALSGVTGGIFLDVGLTHVSKPTVGAILESSCLFVKLVKLVDSANLVK